MNKNYMNRKVRLRVLVGSFGPGSGLTSWYQSGVDSRIVMGIGKSPHIRLGLMVRSELIVC